jgi:hypothetical protein
MLKTSTICPISYSSINERVARLNAGFTLLLIFVFVFTQNVIPVVFLAIDFLLRSAGRSDISPFAQLSKNLAVLLKLEKKIINAGPKIFAARIGFLFSSVIGISFVLNWPVVSYSLAAVLGLFSFLESALGICVACNIYPFIYRMTYGSVFNPSSGSKSIPYTGFRNQ